MKWPRGRAETDNSDACGGNPERLTRPTLLRPRRSHSGEFVARQNDLPVPVLSSQQEDIVFEGFFQDAVARRRPNSPQVSDGPAGPHAADGDRPRSAPDREPSGSQRVAGPTVRAFPEHVGALTSCRGGPSAFRVGPRTVPVRSGSPAKYTGLFQTTSARPRAAEGDRPRSAVANLADFSKCSANLVHPLWQPLQSSARWTPKA